MHHFGISSKLKFIYTYSVKVKEEEEENRAKKNESLPQNTVKAVALQKEYRNHSPLKYPQSFISFIGLHSHAHSLNTRMHTHIVWILLFIIQFLFIYDAQSKKDFANDTRIITSQKVLRLYLLLSRLSGFFTLCFLFKQSLCSVWVRKIAI